MVYLLFNIANASSVSLTTNSKEGNNMFCPGEPIIVKCSVRDTVLEWHIGETSFVIERTKQRILFTSRPWDLRTYIYRNTSIGRLNFYRNESYVGSIYFHSFLNSELHMHLKDANDFIEVSCREFLVYEITIINITVFPGMLIMVFDKLICYCKFVLLYFFLHFSLRNTSS